MTTEKHSSPTVEVPFEVQIITIEHDTWIASQDGRTSVGSEIDAMVYHAMERGELIGKITVDFTEFSKAFSVDARIEKVKSKSFAAAS